MYRIKVTPTHNTIVAVDKQGVQTVLASEPLGGNVIIKEDEITHAKFLRVPQNNRVILLSKNVEVKVLPPTVIPAGYGSFDANGLQFQCEPKQNQLEIRCAGLPISSSLHVGTIVPCKVNEPRTTNRIFEN